MEHARQQRGFSVVEFVVVLVVATLVVGVGTYIVWHGHGKKQYSAAQQATQTTTFTDSAHRYSVQYPSSWSAIEAADCCEAPHDTTQISRGVTILPPAQRAVPGYGLAIQADKTAALAQNVEQSWKANNHTPQAMTIHGYEAQYVQTVFTGDAERYVDDAYLISHNGTSVYVTFREKYYHQYPAEDWSAAPQDLKTFHDILQSLTFLN